MNHSTAPSGPLVQARWGIESANSRSRASLARGFADILAEEYRERLDESARDYLRRISNAAIRLDALIRDVLNYSKIVQGELKLECVDPARVVRDIVETYPHLSPGA